MRDKEWKNTTPLPTTGSFIYIYKHIKKKLVWDFTDFTNPAETLSGETNRPKPDANILVGVWDRLIRFLSKRL